MPDRSEPLDDEGQQTSLRHKADVGGFALLVSSAAGVRLVPLVGRTSFVIGRAPDCEIVIGDDSVSRKHARLRLDEMSLEDLASTNGTRVQGRPVASGASVPITVGTAFELGGAMFVLQPAQATAAASSAAGEDVRPSTLLRVGDAGPVVLDPTMKNLYALLDIIGPSPLHVLILGETGVGKEVYAEELHRRSPRAKKPLLRLNCAALPETLLEAELFGYEKGAFTGAVAAKAGLFEAADGGTVFLDEVAEIPLGTQAKLLRVLESGEVLRLGSIKPKRVDVRFVSATNRDVRKLVGQETFRADLYFRLNGMTVTLPPLRSRRADIAPLARHFLARAAKKAGRARASMTDEAMKLLERFDWPGNVRELRNVIERALVMSTGGPIDAQHLALADDAFEAVDDVHRTVSLVGRPSAAPRGEAEVRAELHEIERQRVLDALAQAGGNQSRAAKMLGISRHTLINRIKEYGLVRPRK